MRRASSSVSRVKVTLSVVVLQVALQMALMACSKRAPEAIEAPAVAAESPPVGAAAGQDNVPPPGVDIAKFDDLQKKVFFRIVNSEPSICGQAQSLIQSAKKDPSCRRSLNAVRYVAKLVDQGFTDSEITEALTKRYRTATAKFIDVAEAPMKGSPNAKVTLVEFADYECPHCKRFQPVLRQILDEFHGEVKLYFKHYPLPQHTNARLAAEAAVAAQKQGKFWQFEDKLWVNQDSLSPAEMEKYAKESGLDVSKFRQDLDSKAVKERVQKDRVDGSTLGLSSTPTLYINGREFTDNRDTESLREWIKEELAR
jgi:protein-disulfide isomerase